MRSTKNKFPNTEAPSQSFLEWLIGFTEGDVCFKLNSRCSSCFIITQSSGKVQVLEYIKLTQDFGRVIKQGLILADL